MSLYIIVTVMRYSNVTVLYGISIDKPKNSSVATLPPTSSSSTPPVGPVHPSSPAIKRPITKLQEYCQRNNLEPPDYKKRQVTGGFCFVVTVKDKQYDGEIKSKKQDAKHSAADVALQELYSSRYGKLRNLLSFVSIQLYLQLWLVLV